MGLSCPFQFSEQSKIVMYIVINRLLTKREVKMAAHGPRSFLCFY